MLLRLCASFCLVFCALVSAQTKDLLSLAAGDSVYFGALFEENNEVYGYVSIYDLEAVNKRERKYEYIILDTRLNEVANGEFIAPDYDYFTEGIQSVSKIGNKLLIGKRHWPRTFAIIIFYTYVEIDLDSNIVTGPFYYENDQFHEGFRDPKKVKKEQKKIDAFDKLLSFNNGYLYTQVSYDLQKLSAYDSQRNLKWERTYLDEKGKKVDKKKAPEIIKAGEGLLVLMEQIKKKKTLVFIDPEKGDVLFTYDLETKDSDYSYNYIVKRIEDKIILTGKVSNYSADGYYTDGAKGFFKKEFDLNGTVQQDKVVLWEALGDALPMNVKGKNDDGYKLAAREYFILEDGRVVYITEQFKGAGALGLVSSISGVGDHRYKDMLIIEFDSDFVLNQIETIEKEISRVDSSSDYLFSQPINNGNDFVFFYRDYRKDTETKEKKWTLGIGKVMGGTISYEEIPMSSDEFNIYPFIAKEGYVLLQEYNYKEKINRIRLEKINL